MKIRSLIIILATFLFTGSLFFLIGADNPGDPGNLAYKVMKTAESYKRRGEVYEAGKIFLEAAMMYKNALKNERDNRGYKTNFKYCLGTRGLIQIKKGQNLIIKKKFGEAARYFKWAADAYELALKELPGERNFETNLKYARYHGGSANFEDLLINGGKAPGFIIEGFSGNRINLKDLKDKVVLLEFWTGWCPSCKKSMPKLEQLYKDLSAKGLEIVAIAMDKEKIWKKYGSDKKAIETSKSHTFKFGWGDAAISTAYGNFNSVPTIILIDRSGNLIKKVPPGEQTRKNLSKLIRSLL